MIGGASMQSCSAYSIEKQKQLTENTYKFKNQQLTFKMHFNFKTENAISDSTMLIYTNNKGNDFQIRIPKEEEIETYEKMKPILMCDFEAKEVKENKYIIDVESIKIKKIKK